MKIITSVTMFNDAVGMRLSATFSEIDGDTGRVLKDNERFDRVITDSQIKQIAAKLFDYANGSIPD